MGRIADPYSWRPLSVMRASVSSSVATAVLALGLALAIWPQPGRTESHRDYMFSDLDGHLVIRFVGIGPAGLDAAQADEVLDQEFSTMIHDRLRADLLFEDEPRDPEWAASMEPEIEAKVRQAGQEFSAIFVECRAVSCRVVMQQPGHWSAEEQLPVLATVQASLEAFIAAHQPEFEPVFMMTAYHQLTETAHIKAFLRRTGRTFTHRVDR